MTLEESDRSTLINIKTEKSKKAIEDVDFLIKNDKLTLAVNRIYYGLFYAASALALKYLFSTNKHQQLIGWFNMKFIKENKIDGKYGRILHKAFDKRTKGDYDDFVVFEKEEVEEMFSEMKEFVSKIIEMLNEKNIEK